MLWRTLRQLRSDNFERHQRAVEKILVASGKSHTVKEKLVAKLVAALKDDSWWMRKAAAETLGNIKDVRAVEPLVEALKDWHVQKTAAEALGNIKDPKAVWPLIAVLLDCPSTSPTNMGSQIV